MREVLHGMCDFSQVQASEGKALGDQIRLRVQDLLDARANLNAEF
jgi:hypothetical protein